MDVRGVDPRLGAQIAGYRIEAPLGRGGMSVVYLAEDLRLHRKVAIKLIAPELAQDVRFRERFLAESELAASLDHPNVIPIYEAGEAQDVLFIAMRYVERKDLKVLLDGESLPPGRVIDLARQIAGALDAAHARGLVHRDVKPSNVLVDAATASGDHVYLADFGLTRRLAEQGYRSGTELSLGTPGYVAPEQIEGKEVDGRADVYSLAALLFECLAGEPPFHGPSEAAILFAHLEEDPPSLHDRRPELPEAIDAVMERALAKSPDARYGSCGELVEAASAALGIGRPAPWRRARVALGLLVATLVTAGLLAFFLVRGQGTPPIPTSGDSLIRIDPATNDVAATIPVGRNPSAVAVGENGVWVANRDDATVSRIDARTDRAVLVAKAHGAPVDIAVRPQRVVVANGPVEADLAIINAASGVQEDLFSMEQGRFFGAMSVAAADSGFWVATGDRRVGRLDILSGRLVDPVVIPQPPAERSDAIFSGIAVGEGAVWVVGDPLEHTAWRIDLSTGELVATIPLPVAPKAVAVGAGGVWVTSQLDDTLSRIDPVTNRIATTIPVGKGPAGVAVGAGSIWVANAIDGTVSRVDPRSLRVETIDVDGHPDDVAVGAGAVWVTSYAGGFTKGGDTLTIGVLAPCEGTFGHVAPESFAGAELPLLERGARLAGPSPDDGVEGAIVAGREVRLVFGCGDDSAENALSEARRLVELQGADVLLGSYFAGEAFAIREYAKTQPAVTFVNGVAAGPEVTLRDAAPNYYRFALDAAQSQAGVGKYAYDTLGWRKVVTIADVDTFNYPQAAGFVAEFCALGGTIAEQIWVPVGTRELAPFVGQVPRRGVDGFVMAANPPTMLAFFEGLPQLKGKLADLLIGSILMTVAPIPETLGERLEGVVLGAPDDTETPAAKAAASRFARAFPGLADLGYFFFGSFYTDHMEAVLRALEAVDGDLTDDQRRFQTALASLELDTPTTGHIRLDKRRQAIGSNYLIQFGYENGRLTYETLSVVEDVEQTFNGYFRPDDPLPMTNEIECKHGKPPPWTHSG
jgi:YVTN family beta-propeller protein